MSDTLRDLGIDARRDLQDDQEAVDNQFEARQLDEMIRTFRSEAEAIQSGSARGSLARVLQLNNWVLALERSRERLGLG